MRRVSVIAVLVCAATLSPAASADDGGPEASVSDASPDSACADAGALACPSYVRYENEKFAFSVDVPTFLARKGADADGRGQPFAYVAGGKKIRVRAWAMYNAPVMTVEELFGDWSRRGRVEFKAIAGNTWVVRGTENGQLYYMRSILSDGIITTIEVVYDPSFAEDFEPVLARMGATLLTLPGQGVRAKGAKGH
jgi:uncharacterized protein YodC (DUF2158 family)